MDILERYLGYETWTLRYFITRCQELKEVQFHQPFDIGHATLAAPVPATSTSH